MCRYQRIVLLLLVIRTCGLASAWAFGLHLEWADNATNEQGFRCERSVGPNGPFAQVCDVAQNIQTWDDLAVQFNIQYCYRVLAYNVGGNSGYSNVACATVTPEKPDVTLKVACLQTPEVWPPNTLAVFPFDEGQGTTTADVVGNTTAGLSGVTWVTGHAGKGLSVPAGGKITTALTAANPQRTYMAWVLRPAAAGTYPRIFDKRTAGVESELWYVDAGALRFLVIAGSAPGSWTAPAPPANVWTHVALSYDRGTPTVAPKVYYNGVPQAVTPTSTPAGAFVTTADPYVIGNRGAGDRAWGGTIDDFKIFNRVLSQTEIQGQM